jgi:hypothetical protein
MARNWISAVILLVITLSMVNAAPFQVYKRDLFLLHKRAVDLVPCDPPSDTPLTGTVDPDPAAGATSKANLKFVAAKDLPKVIFTTTVTDAGKAVDGGVTTSDLCTDGGLKCPVAKGQEVTITSSTAVPDGVKAPEIEYNVNDGAITIACGVAKAKAADGGKAPADGGKAPADAPDGGKEPADGGKEPADGGKAPADGGKAPDGAPDGDGGAPPPPDGDGAAPPPPDGAGGAGDGGDGKGKRRK